MSDLQKLAYDRADARISAKQAELSGLTDEELMKLDYDLTESLEKFERDAVLSVSVAQEVYRRSDHACRIWRRWLSPGGRKRCGKWLQHLEDRERRSEKLLREIASRTFSI